MRYMTIRKGLPPRIGFTLVELLVVIAIIGVLVGLLLPAVQAAREAARRMQCSNNLKQIGLALHNYHDAHRSFPKVWYYWNGNSNGSDRQPAGFYSGFGWRVMILPYMEQVNLYNQFNFSQPIHSNVDPISNLKLIQTPIPTYLCPSDPAGPQVKSGQQYLWTNWCFPHGNCPKDVPVAVTTYKGLTGAGYDQVFSQVPYPAGMFDRRRGAGLSFSSMSDGTSNTIAVTESSPEFNAWTGWATWHVAAHAQQGPNHARRFYGSVGRTASQHGWTAGLTASSFHTGGVNMVMGDGSVHFLSDSINLPIYQQLVDPDDGLPIGGFNLN